MSKQLGQRAVVIGSGFSGLSAASFLAKGGLDVTILEKNATPGGRARAFHDSGFTFDMGPSWYWMPDVFEQFFGAFGKAPSDFYDLIRLDPSYAVWFGKEEKMDVPADLNGLYDLFESIEKGSAAKLKKFLHEAEFKYKVGMQDLVYKPGLSLREYSSPRLLSGMLRLHVFRSFSKYVRNHFKDPRLISLLEFPVLFLGAKPGDTPALYSLMNYADMVLGTWYPLGGMYKVVDAMASLATDLGADLRTSSEVSRIVVKNGKAVGVEVDGAFIPADLVLGSADYHHVEQNLLPDNSRRYSATYWEKRTMAPSSLIFYLGVDHKLDSLRHHNLFFDKPFEAHASAIYDDPRWPEQPLFYVCAPSRSDSSVAPEGKENLFVLVPVAPGLEDSPETRELYFQSVMDRLESLTGERIRDHLLFKRSYAHRDFEQDYHAFRGNAYGLANTLRQTAILKPSIRSKKVRNLFYAGQLTVPGPGVPPALISGQVAAGLAIQHLNR